MICSQCMYGNEEEVSVKKKSEQSAARLHIQERKTAYRKMKLTIFTWQKMEKTH